MLLSTGRADLAARCARWRSTTSATRRSRSPGSQAGIVTDTVPHQGADPRRARRPHPRRARRRARRARGRLPGRVHRQGRHDARPRRLGHDRGRARGRRRGRGVRDLHRRGRRVLAPTRGSCPTRASSRSSRFEEMLEMSASGAGVLQLRCVEYARNHGVRIHCRSSFTEEPGTFVVGEEETMERPLDHRRHPLARRGAGHAARRPRQPGRRGPHLHARSPTPTSTST